MAMTLVFANKGTGKTTLLARLAKRYVDSKKYEKVYSNTPIRGTYQIKSEELGLLHIENSLILIDEGAIEFPNTQALKKYQKDFFVLSRHYNCDIFFISQSWEDLNISIRRLYDSIWLMKKSFLIPSVSVYRRITKKIEVDKQTHQIIDGYYINFPLPFITYKFIYRPRYYYLFDSFIKPQLKEFVPSEYRFPERITFIDKLRKRTG